VKERTMNQTLIRHDPPDARIAISHQDLAARQQPASTEQHARRDLARMAGEGAFIALLVTVALGAMMLAATALQLPTGELTWTVKAAAIVASALAIAIIPCAAIDAQRR
jgi:hypothetical protein